MSCLIAWGMKNSFRGAKKIYHQFMPIIENHLNDPDIVKPTYAAHVVFDSLLRAPFYFTGEMGTNVRIGPKIVDWRGGSCLDMCDMVVYICRAFGHSLRHRGAAHARE